MAAAASATDLNLAAAAAGQLEHPNLPLLKLDHIKHVRHGIGGLVDIKLASTNWAAWQLVKALQPVEHAINN